MDDGSYDGDRSSPIWAFFAGAIYGLFGYFVVRRAAARRREALGSQGTYRRARHVLAFARGAGRALARPLAGEARALRRATGSARGGRDTGAGGRVFDLLELAFFAWAAALLVIGVRAVHGWTWRARCGRESRSRSSPPVVRWRCSLSSLDVCERLLERASSSSEIE